MASPILLTLLALASLQYATAGRELLDDPTEALWPPPPPIDSCPSVFNVLATIPSLSITHSIIEKSPKLLTYLGNSSHVITFFAPTDEAWGNVLESHGCTLSEFLSREKLLNIIINYFIVQDRAYNSSRLTDGKILTTRYSNILEVLVTNNSTGIYLTGEEDITAKVTTPFDIPACHSIIHALDTVLQSCHFEPCIAPPPVIESPNPPSPPATIDAPPSPIVLTTPPPSPAVVDSPPPSPVEESSAEESSTVVPVATPPSPPGTIAAPPSPSEVSSPPPSPAVVDSPPPPAEESSAEESSTVDASPPPSPGTINTPSPPNTVSPAPPSPAEESSAEESSTVVPVATPPSPPGTIAAPPSPSEVSSPPPSPAVVDSPLPPVVVDSPPPPSPVEESSAEESSTVVPVASPPSPPGTIAAPPSPSEVSSPPPSPAVVDSPPPPVVVDSPPPPSPVEESSAEESSTVSPAPPPSPSPFAPLSPSPPPPVSTLPPPPPLSTLPPPPPTLFPLPPSPPGVLNAPPSPGLPFGNCSLGDTCNISPYVLAPNTTQFLYNLTTDTTFVRRCFTIVPSTNAINSSECYDRMLSTIDKLVVSALPICAGQLRDFSINGTDFTDNARFELIGATSAAFKFENLGFTGADVVGTQVCITTILTELNPCRLMLGPQRTLQYYLSESPYEWCCSQCTAGPGRYVDGPGAEQILPRIETHLRGGLL